MRRIFILSITISVIVLAVSITTGIANHDPNVIHACVGKVSGNVRIVSSPSKCSKFLEKAIEWNIMGPPGGASECDINMVKVGPICVDEYEASVWSMPPDEDGNPQGTQYGDGSDDYPCSDNGNDCSDSAANPIYAVSAPGETPSAFITWFQAQQACANVGKRLLRNGEWQMAAAGTPDTGGADDGSTTCNTDNLEPGTALTGTRSNCVSNWGVFDMVGNLWEWVEDWMQDNSDSDGGSASTALYGSDGIFGIDEAFPEADRFPAALVRGGDFFDVSVAGVFALNALSAPSISFLNVGFRCAR